MDNKELQSFYDGYSLHAYNVFGAHFTKNGVCFRLYAPNARSVRLVGDFNNWNSDATHLKKINKEVMRKRNEVSGEKWTNMTMIVERSGKMHVDFDYTDLTEKAYQYSKKWKKKYLY